MEKPDFQIAFEMVLARVTGNLISAQDSAAGGRAKPATDLLKQSRRLLSAAEAILESADTFKFVKE